MKTKILRKVLPGAPAGTKVEVEEMPRIGFPGAYSYIGLNKYHGCYIPNSELSEWVENEKSQKPKEGGKYWTIHGDGEIQVCYWGPAHGSEYHEAAYEFGNCFHTKEEAIAARDRIREVLRELHN